MVYKLVDFLFCLLGAYLYTETIETVEKGSITKRKRMILIFLFGLSNFLLRQFLVDNNQFIRIAITYLFFVIVSKVAYKEVDFKSVFFVVTVYLVVVVTS